MRQMLRRHFRPGTMTPYIPQEHFCDKPVTLDNKRANIISGRAGPEAAARRAEKGVNCP